MSPLATLIAFDPDGDLRDSLESFVARALFDAGVWPSTRTSDGVASCRVIERTPVRLRVCGRVWAIDQTLHSFWLDVVRAHSAPGALAWTLYFDVDATSVGARRARDAIDAIDDPHDVAWVVRLDGSE
jgi:hypothetical protein